MVKAGDVLKKIQEANLPAPPWTVAWFNAEVSRQNGHLDEAINLYREILDPAKQDKGRKLHFNTDYVVRNQLALTLFHRSEQEDDEAGQERFLKESVREYEKTLELDAENLDAHYGLSQVYGELGKSLATTEMRTTAPDLAELERLSARFFDTKSADAARELARALEAFAQKPPKLGEPKLPFVTDAIKQARKVFQDDPDSAHRAAAAHVLGRLHLVAHAVYRPDDLAKNVTQKYRDQHPPANNAAKALIVYPLQRDGAPGL